MKMLIAALSDNPKVMDTPNVFVILNDSHWQELKKLVDCQE